MNKKLENQNVMTLEIEETLNQIYQERLNKMRGGECNDSKKTKSIKKLFKSIKQFARRFNRK